MRGLICDTPGEMSPGFGHRRASEGRSSIPPERLPSALLPRVLYGIRSERQLTEQLNCNPLIRSLVGAGPVEPVWDATTVTKNRESLEGRRPVPEIYGQAGRASSG
ncbi:MAG: transposase [Acetobacteraceae bacterium]